MKLFSFLSILAIFVSHLNWIPSTLVSSSPGSAPTSPLAGLSWERLGGPLGGYGTGIVVHPDDPGTFYLSDKNAGFFVSQDGGKNWEASNKGIQVRSGQSGDLIPVTCLAMDPHNKNLWVGTADPGSVYRSQDGGDTWQLRSRGIAGYPGLTIRSITISPLEPDVLFAAAEVSSTAWNFKEKKGLLFDQAKGILLKSTDGGSMWLPVWRGESLANKTVIDPQNPLGIFLATGAYDREAANALPGGDTPIEQMGSLGVLSSTDGGATWSPASSGLQNMHIQSISIHDQAAGLLLAGAGNLAFPDGSGIYRTINAGKSWERVGGIEGEVITAVLFSPTDPDLAYAAGLEHHYFSSDRGQSWIISAPVNDSSWGPAGIQPGTPLVLTADPKHPKSLYTLTDLGGIYRSGDYGRTWEEIGNGYSGASIRALSVDPDNPAVVYALSAGGPFKSSDGGITWQGINSSEYPVTRGGSVIEVNPDQTEKIYLADGSTGTLQVSDDAGQTWIKTLDLGADLAQYGAKDHGVMTLAFSPGGDSIFAGTGVLSCILSEKSCRVPVFLSVLNSKDSGANWKAVDAWRVNGLTVTDLVVNPENPQQLWAATGAGWVLVSQDGGENWAPLTEQLYARHVTALALHPENDDIIYAATYNYGVFMSTNQGQSWQWRRLGMDPYEPISSILIDPVRPNVMYAGSLQRGIYLSEDGGKIWRLINSGLSVRSIRSLAISADGKTLYAGTEGGGVFRLSALSPPEWQALQPTATPMPSATPSPTHTTQPTKTTLPSMTAAPTLSPPTPTSLPIAPTSRTSCPGSFFPILMVSGWITSKKLVSIKKNDIL